MSKFQGLTNQQIEQSIEKHGRNILTPPKKEPLWKLFLEKFNDPVIRILIIAAVLSFAISIAHGEYYETIGIIVAILLSTTIAFYFERDAAKKFELLNQINEQTLYKVWRDGELKQVEKQNLVVGDIVVLDSGEEIPADCILLEATELSVNESTLTGELQMHKSTNEAEFDKEATYPSNHILRSTTIIEGNCTAEIIRVGDATEYGKVATLATEKNSETTPLTKQLDRLAKLIGVVGFSIAFVTFTALTIKSVFWGEISSATLGQKGLLGAALLGLFIMLGRVWVPVVYDGLKLAGKEKELPTHIKKMGFLYWIILGLLTFGAFALAGLPFGVKAIDGSAWISLDMAKSILDSFMICVTLIVVSVPEGLPMSVTLSLALSMRKMLRANNLVRKMHASETIGATTVICTDKTGTLTKNEMRVADFVTYIDNNALLNRAIAVNSTANLDAEGKAIGNPTEGALILWLNDNGVDYSELRVGAESQMPFSSKVKMMATVAEVDGKKILFVKGAPEYVLERCTSGDTVAAKAKLLEFQNKAMRTLAFAIKDYTTGGDIEDELNNLTLQAVAAIADPVRDDVPAAVASCMSAGITIKMVTGDTPATAREIARQVGLWDDATDSEVNAITGPEWDALSDEDAYERAPLLKIMARARPQDKQRLVQLLQKRGEVVAVTGDGTNDAPALNFANVGLSMGSGTSVAKEASDITLLDDSFASIARAVMWGRSVYLNIQRFVLFQLTINVAALLIVLIGAVLGFDLPLTVTQMLWVNLIMDTFAAGALASLPPDERVMRKKPRSNKDFIISKPMGLQIITVGVSFVVAMIALLFFFQDSTGAITRQNQTLFFTIFVMLQFWNMFNAKAYKSGRFGVSALGKATGFITVGLLIIIGQWLIVTFGGEVFRVEPLTLQNWLIAIGATSIVLWVGEFGRLFTRSKQ